MLGISSAQVLNLKGTLQVFDFLLLFSNISTSYPQNKCLSFLRYRNLCTGLHFHSLYIFDDTIFCDLAQGLTQNADVLWQALHKARKSR